MVIGPTEDCLDILWGQRVGLGKFLVPTQPCLFIVNREKIFTGIIRKSIMNVMTTARDKSRGTRRKWLRPLKERPPMEATSHRSGRLNAIPKIVVSAPGLVRAKYTV